MEEDGPSVAEFLHKHLNPRISATEWRKVVSPPWPTTVNHRGFLLTVDAEIVGVSVVLCSQREWAGKLYTVGNLAALSILPGYSVDGIRLLRRQLRETRIEFTDLAPTVRLIPINEKLGFSYLDTSTRVTLNLPWLPRLGVTVTSNPKKVSRVLKGNDALVYEHHLAAGATRHIVIANSDAYGYLVIRRQELPQWRRRPLIALPLYVGGQRELIKRHWQQVASHILFRHGLIVTFAERRLLAFTPRVGIERKSPRKRMFYGQSLPSESVDYLYSDLALFEAI